VILSTAFAAMMPWGRWGTRGVGDCTGGLGRGDWRDVSAASILAFRGLCGVGSQKTVFERRAIKAADDSLHFIRSGRFDKSEAFRFLSFVIANHFYGIGYKIFGGKPLLNIIGSDPRGEIAKKYSKAHSVGLFTPLVGLAAHQGGNCLPNRWYHKNPKANPAVSCRRL
jgi:hypothetical protein